MLTAAMQRRLDDMGVSWHGGQRLDLPGSRCAAVVGRVCDHQPLLHSERVLGRTMPDRVVRGLAAAALMSGAGRALLAVGDGDPELVSSLQREARQTRVELVVLPASYPMDPRSLLCDLAGAMGASVPAAGLDRSLVLEAQVLCDLAMALEGKAPLRRMVTVAGAVERRAVMQAPLGTPLESLVDACGGCSDPAWVAFHNGAAGGRPVVRHRCVDLDTSGVVVLPHDHPLVVRCSTPLADQLRRIPSACAACRLCSEACTARLQGAPLEPHEVMLALSAGWPGSDPPLERSLAASLECMGCGVCSVSCPGMLDPAALVGAVAADLSSRGVQGRAGGSLRFTRDRAGRRLAVERMTLRLGLSAWDGYAYQSPRTHIPETITLPATSPLGRARVPVVSPGQPVARGDRVALAAAGSGEVDCLSPVAGTVLSVDPDDGVTIRPR